MPPAPDDLPPPRDEPRRPRYLFAGLLALVMLLQLVTLLIQRDLGQRARRHRNTIAYTEHQILLARTYERTSYLALAGLAASDWELLLEQRRTAQALSEKFKQGIRTLHHGAQTELGGIAIEVAAVEDLGLRDELAEVLRLWNEAVDAQVRLLRSNNYQLKGNRDLDEFRAITAGLDARLDDVNTALRDHNRVVLGDLERLQTIVLVVGLAVVGLLGLLVLRRLIIPFGRNMQQLRRSQAQLQAARDQLEQRVQERTAELARANEQLHRQSDQLEQRVQERTAELRDAQRQLVDTAIAAGRAEVATNVLHNIGNVLSSVNVHIDVITRGLGDRKWASLGQLAQLLREHQDDLPRFVQSKRGRLLPELCGQLAAHQQRQHQQLTGSADKLHEQIEHIRQIVVLQQKHARSVGLVEEVDLVSLFDDALSLNESAIERHQIALVRELQEVAPIRTHKHKALQILLNLISNAKYALTQTPAAQRRITVRLARPDPEHVRLSVIDNGCGIDPELLTRIFQHGFTTRREGHGFGLHASALAAAEMGGTLEAYSEGLGRGACFVLELPVDAAAAVASRPSSRRASRPMPAPGRAGAPS